MGSGAWIGDTLSPIRASDPGGKPSLTAPPPASVPAPTFPGTGMVLWTTSSVAPQWVSRQTYYQQATFSCDYYCSETWRTFGAVAWNLPELGAAVFMCYRYRECEVNPETVGSMGPDVQVWLGAEANFYAHRANNDPLYYPYSAYPLGK